MTSQLRTVAALNYHWTEIATSPAMTRSLRRWRRDIPPIDAVTADELVAAARDRPPGQRDCPVLDALVCLAGTEELALSVVVQAMLPRWCSIIARTRHPGLSREETAAVVVSVGTETILTCLPASAATPTDYRLWSDTRHRVRRYLARNHPVRETPWSPADLTHRQADARHDQPCMTSQEVSSWIVAQTGVSPSVAHLVASTRMGETTLHAEAVSQGVKYGTVAQRRARAEQKLRRALTAPQGLPG